MTVLVTGATGFVGSAVVRALLEQGEAVRVLVRTGSPRTNLEGLDVEVVLGDLTDPDSLASATRHCRQLYHVAADYRLWVPDPERMERINVEGTRNILRAAADAGVERMVYTSSVATLGNRDDGQPADEQTPVHLNDMVGTYKRSKFLAENEVRRLVADQGLPVVTVNPSTPIGPRDLRPTPTGRLVIDAIVGRMPAYVDTGLNFVHVEDVATGHVLAMAHGRVGERYILGGENLHLKEFLARLANLTGRSPPRVRLPRAPMLPLAWLSESWARLRGGPEPRLTVAGLRLARKQMFYSSAKARRELGYAPRPIEAALADTVRWFASHGRPGAA